MASANWLCVWEHLPLAGAFFVVITPLTNGDRCV